MGLESYSFKPTVQALKEFEDDYGLKVDGEEDSEEESDEEEDSEEEGESDSE